MVTEELRQNFLRLIDTIANEQSLMETSLQQVERGEFIANEELQKEVKTWLGK